MMNVDYKQFKAIRISALLLATTGVVLATLIGGFLLVYVAHLPAFVAFAFTTFSPTDAAIVIAITISKTLLFYVQLNSKQTTSISKIV